MPTGGVSLDNVNEYPGNNKIVACGGSFMVKESYIDNNNREKITSPTKRSVSTMLGLEIGHIGINHENEESATFNDDGTRRFIYLAEEFGGFGIHLIQKK